MRNFLTIFSIVLFISCSSMPYVYQNIQINEDELRHHVNSLVQTPEPRNFINIESLNMAAGYIDSVFRKYCNRIVTEPFMVEGNEYKNIICSFGPDDGPRIIIGAHYDVCENQPGAASQDYWN